MIRLVFADEALHDLESIYLYIAEDNLAAAERHRERLRWRWDQLLNQPRIGRSRDELKPGYRSVSEGAYVILYRLVSAAEEVQIMRVLHGKRDIFKVLKDDGR